MLPAQTDLVFGAAPTFSITATELNPSGYSYSICYGCSIIPLDASPTIMFSKDLIVITSTVIDCSVALVDAAFVNPPPIPYNSGGTSVTVVTAYTDIFTHSFLAECPIN